MAASGDFVSRRRRKISPPQFLSLTEGALSFGRQKPVNAGNHLGREVTLERERSGIGRCFQCWTQPEALAENSGNEKARQALITRRAS